MTTTAVRYHPWRHLRAQQSWTFVTAELPEHRRAQTDWTTRTVTIAKGLTQAKRRCSLAHELVHMERGPVAADARTAAREERLVEAIMARRMIELRDLGEALAWSQYPADVADELWVDGPTLRARLDNLTDAERAYLEARLSFMDWH